MFNIKKLLTLVAVISVAGCSSSDYLFSDSTKASPKKRPVVKESTVYKKDAKAIAPIAVEKPEPVKLPEPVAKQPVSVAQTYETRDVSLQHSSSMSFVTQKINTFKGELSQLKNSVINRTNELKSIKEKMAQDSKEYYEVVAEINSRLQMGTTSGNPILNAKWRDATMKLDKVSQDVTAMNNLASKITADSGMTTYLLDSVRASYNISGAVEADHEELKGLEDETIQTAVQNERLLSDVNEDIVRQQKYLSNEKSNLANLAVAIRDGQLYSNGVPGTQSMKYRKTLTESEVPYTAKAANVRKPLVEIRFTKENIAFEQPLYKAMQKALEQRQDISFEIIGVATRPDVAKRYVNNVTKSMINMGVPASRIKTSVSASPNTRSPEVKIFVK